MMNPNNNTIIRVLASFFFLLLLLLLLSPSHAAGVTRRGVLGQHRLARDIKLINDSKVKVDILWVNPQTRERTTNTAGGAGVPKGGDIVINSYVDHLFEIQEMPHRVTRQCKNGGLKAATTDNDEDSTKCRVVTYRVSDREDQIIYLNSDYELDIVDSRSRALDKAKEVSKECPIPDATSAADLEEQVNQYTQCIQQQLDSTLEETEDDIQFEASIRHSMGTQLTKYACESRKKKIPTSDSQKNETKAGIHVQHLFASENSRILLLDSLLLKYRYSCHNFLKHEQKNQNDIVIPWSMISSSSSSWSQSSRGRLEKNRSDNDAVFFQKTYQLMKNLLHWTTLSFDEQKRIQKDADYPLFDVIVQNSTTSMTTTTESNTILEQDHLIGKLILFCYVPTNGGGGIMFPETGVHVNPVAGSALLVSYRDPLSASLSETNIVNEHIQCPLKTTRQEDSDDHEEDDDDDEELVYLQHNLFFQN